jgi:uncharacterized protein involved in outer membrane biogenesis
MKNIKKVFLIVFVIFFVFFVLLAGAAFFFLRNFDPNKFKPQMIAQAEQMLNRRVELGNLQLGLSLKQGIFLSISGIKIVDDPQFSKENFLTIERLGLGLDILSFITQRQINVSNLEIVCA